MPRHATIRRLAKLEHQRRSRSIILKMSSWWRPGSWLLLLMVAAALVWVGIVFMHHARTPFSAPITDLGATKPLNQPGGGIVSAEAYAVYSALYQASMQEPLVFSEDSLTDIPQVNGSCLRPTTVQEHEMNDAFVAANQQSHRWERKFSIPQGYRLVAHNDLAQAETCAATHGLEAASCASYKQLRYVRLLGVPGFDRSHTRALVSVIKSCGHLCGNGGIFAVGKADGIWQRSTTTDFTRDCSWMY
jgi:hypothetical protein